MIRAGFHLSAAGGVQNSAVEATREKYMAFQLFVSNPRSWKTNSISTSDARAFVDASSDVLIPFAHLPYLCNPSSYLSEVHEKSVSMLVENIENCNKIGLKYLVVHLGSHLGKGTAYGKERAIESIVKVIEKTDNVTLLLENSSGYKNSVGSNMKEIGAIISGIASDRVGLCFDTCHAFAAGYDIRKKEEVERLAGEITTYIGKDRMKLVHLNDAKFELGSGLDRHWHIGEGNIGAVGFKTFFSEKMFREGSFVMEVPPYEKEGHRPDMLALEKILKSCNLSANLLD